jgi:DNA-binding winged helix-turn-helix (wHTH) protein
MEKITVISKNQNTWEIIAELLRKNYDVILKKIPDSFSYFQQNNSLLAENDISGVALFIVDITSLTFTKNPLNKQSVNFTAYSPTYYKDNLYTQNFDFKVLDELTAVQIPKLLIINSEQAGLLFEKSIKYEDIILFKQLQDELLLRVSLILNKYTTKNLKNIIVIKDMIINLEKYELSVEGRTIELTFKEFEMLKYLVQNEDKVFSRNILLSKIWGYDFYGGNRTVDVHMRRIRSKLPSPYDQMLKTIRNVGYMFSKKI